MKRRNFLLCLGLTVVCLGCSWIGWGDKKAAPAPASEPAPAPVVAATPDQLKSSRIVQPLLLERGGKLLIKPFNAGANVEATDELDQIGLRIIRGVLDVQEGLWPRDQEELDLGRFDVGLDEDEKKSDFILRGRVTELYESPGWKKWFLMKPKRRLGIDGQLVDRKTNTAVAVFKDEVTTSDPVLTHKDLGQEIGRKIGVLIFKK